MRNNVKSLYEFLVEYHKQYGIPPTRKEIYKGVDNNSHSTIEIELSELEAQNLIRCIPRTSRGIVVL